MVKCCCSKQEKIKNWFAKFGLISSEKNWHQIHVSGHGERTRDKLYIFADKSQQEFTKKYMLENYNVKSESIE